MAGRITTNQVQLGDSATASQNFHLQTNVDGTLSLNRGNVGTPTQEILRVAGTETVQRIQTFTAQTATGTSVDFLNIPTWAKEITVMFNGVSTNGTGRLQVQIGSGAFVTTGYSAVGFGTAATAISTATNTTGFPLSNTTAATDALVANATLTNVSGNIWIFSSVGQRNANESAVASGNLTLAGVLDRIRITANGTDQFDAGSINILVKG